MKLPGHGRYVMSARCMNKNAFMRASGLVADLIDWDGRVTSDCLGYLVQGLPLHLELPIIAPSRAWQVRARAAVCVPVSSMCAYVCEMCLACVCRVCAFTV
jgi:hypothetical protein